MENEYFDTDEIMLIDFNKMVGMGTLAKERKRINAIHLSKIQHQAIQLLAMSSWTMMSFLLKLREY